jgi:hypothetical protein
VLAEKLPNVAHHYAKISGGLTEVGGREGKASQSR